MASSKVKTVLGIADEDVRTIMDNVGLDENVTNEDWDNSAKTRKAVKYSGFDAKRIVAQFYKKFKEYSANPEEAPNVVCGETTSYDRNHLETHLKFFINLFLEYGNDEMMAILFCKDKQSANFLRRMHSSYGITDHDRWDSRVPRTLPIRHLTFERIAQAFAPLTASIIIEKGIKGKFTSKLFRGELPIIMQHAIFSSLIPQDISFSESMREIAIYLKAEISVLHGLPEHDWKGVDTPMKELMESSSQFVDAAISASIMSNAFKLKILTKAGLVSEVEGVIAPTDRLAVMINRVRDIKACTEAMQYGYSSAVVIILSQNP